MKILIKNGRVIDPASGRDEMADVAIAAGRIIAIGKVATDFLPARTIDATGCIVAPGLVDLGVRLKEPGQEHAGTLESETEAAVAGGVTALVCPPDTEPVLDEPGLVDMLKFRAEKLHRSRVFPIGALTRGLQGEVLTEMAELTEAGCVGFGQAEVPIQNTQVLLTRPPSTTPCGCARRTCGLARVWPPAARWPRAWASRVCPPRPKPLRCTRCSNSCAASRVACVCTCAA